MTINFRLRPKETVWTISIENIKVVVEIDLNEQRQMQTSQYTLLYTCTTVFENWFRNCDLDDIRETITINNLLVSLPRFAEAY